MNNPSLLPDNASELEQALAQTGTLIARLPIPFRDLWQPARCPAALLPWLAWTFSVDRWDESWSEEAKRQVIIASFYVHQHKGTIGALRRAVEQLGTIIQITEWWQRDPDGIPGTFSLEIGVRNSGINEQMYYELERLIDDAKPVSRHLIELTITLEIAGYIYCAANNHNGDTLTIYPYVPEEVESRGHQYCGAGLHLIDTLRII